MKVLLLSVTAGQGHNMCARAMQEAFDKRGVESEILDTVKYINQLTGNIVDKGYLTLGKRTPKLWGAIYDSAVKASVKRGPKVSTSSLYTAVSQKLADHINIYRPNVIINTHVFPSMMLTALKGKGMIDVPVIGINTDYTLHPFWEDVIQDYIVLACDKMYYAVRQRGIPKEQILPWGIPVRQQFLKGMSRQQARQKLGLPEKLTLCLMGGSMGFGDLREDVFALDALDLDFQVQVVCGGNESLYGELTKLKNEGKFKKNILIYGFSNNMDEIMSASDAVCTKPGGLSTSETLAINRPLILLKPIPGLEEINAWFLVNHGVAVRTGKSYSLDEAVYNLFSDSERIEDILHAQQKFNPGNAADRLADFVMERYMP